MNSKRIFRKLGSIVVGTLGISSLLVGCKKETTCLCDVSGTYVYTFTYMYDGVTYTYDLEIPFDRKDAIEMTTEGDCEEVDFDEAEEDWDVDCDEK